MLAPRQALHPESGPPSLFFLFFFFEIKRKVSTNVRLMNGAKPFKSLICFNHWPGFMYTDPALTDFLDITLYSSAEVTAASSEAEGYKYDLFVLRTGYLTFHKGQSSTLLISQILIH